MFKPLFCIFIAFFLIFVSCDQDEVSHPPTLNVEPLYTVYATSGEIVTYNVIGKSGEDLIDLKIRSSPLFFQKDSIFQKFIHNVNLQFKIQTPAEGLAIPVDSILKLSFTLTDYTGFTEVKREIKIISVFPPIIDTTNLSLSSFPDGESFFDPINNVKYTITDIDSMKIHLVYLYDNVYKQTICSPDAPRVQQQALQYGLTYTSKGKNVTKIQKITESWTKITKDYLGRLIVTNEYVSGNPANGIGRSDLKVGDMIAFQLIDNRKGVIRIIGISKSDHSISFEIKIQSKPSEK